MLTYIWMENIWTWCSFPNTTLAPVTPPVRLIQIIKYNRSFENLIVADHTSKIIPSTRGVNSINSTNYSATSNLGKHKIVCENELHIKRADFHKFFIKFPINFRKTNQNKPYPCVSFLEWFWMDIVTISGVFS